VKSERHFDLYDQVFLHHFRGVELKDPEAYELTDIAKALLQEWLKDPAAVAAAFGVAEKELKKMTPEELIQYFLDRLKNRQRLITGVTAGSAHGAPRPWGIRAPTPGDAGGRCLAQQVGHQVAMDRRYRDYSRTASHPVPDG